MPLEPNKAPEIPIASGRVHGEPEAFLNNAIVALVGLPLYFTEKWEVYPSLRVPLLCATVLAVLLCGINPLRAFVSRLARRLYHWKIRPGKPAVLDDEMNFLRVPAESGWSDQRLMTAYEGDVLTMGYMEGQEADPAPYTALRFRKRKDGRIECLIAVHDWDYPNFHRISVPPALAALLYGTRHRDEGGSVRSTVVRLRNMVSSLFRRVIEKLAPENDRKNPDADLQ